MKYRVVGWTEYDGDDVPDTNGHIGYAECSAIVDDIKENSYLFSGWDHQESFCCVPVLNDGKKRCFSQRGWGGIMAEAYGYTGPYDYSLFTFYESIDPEKVKKPRCGFCSCGFTPEVDLSECFSLAVDEAVFRRAEMDDPFRIDETEALRYLDVGDTLTLEFGNEALTLFVTGIERNWDITRTDSEKRCEIVISYDPTRTVKK